ncbi:MFS transporter [Alphaproteobacteria bacterium]|jgi:MFS family permease|nr:MFS transporter [Alphaproteobacteria bacterium]MDA9914328.1 MFS transporter [Alphaproteobacteria bacterium]MDB2478001.1 MFS transporter [Alphaproteobacteria bacterium]
MQNNLVEQDSQQAWFRLAIIFAMSVIGTAGMWSVVIILPNIQNEFTLDRAASTYPYVATMFGYGFGNVIIGRMLDKIGIKKPIIFALSLLVTSYVLSFFAKNVFWLSTIQFFLGFSAAAFFGPMMADISNYFYKRKGLAVSLVASGQHLCGAIWPFVIKDFIIEGDWRNAHLFIALVCSILIPILFYFLGNKVPKMNNEQKLTTQDEDINSKVNLSISNRQIQILLMIAGVLCCVAMSMPQVHIVPLCIDNGYGLAVGTEILSFMLFAAVASRVIFGFLSDKIGPIQTLILGSSLQAISLTMFLPFNSQLSLYIVAICFGLSQGGIVPIYAVIISKFLPSNEVAERVGWLIFATIIGMSLGGWLSGEIYDFTNSYRLAFINGIFWNIMNLCIMIYLFIIYQNSKIITVN